MARSYSSGPGPAVRQLTVRCRGGKRQRQHVRGGHYEPITPTRFLDTSNGTGGTTGPVKAEAVVRLRITGVDGIPAADVTTVAINVGVTAESSSGDIVAYTDGTGHRPYCP